METNMHVRHILGIAIFCGAVGALGGQSVHAQPSNANSFVRFLLLRESRQILADERAIATQDHGNRLLKLLATISPTTARQARQLQRDIAAIQRNVVILQARIDNTTSLLLSLRDQLGTGQPSPFNQLAAQNAAIINSLASRGPFGIPPASISQ
jgi:hypothetical protein